MQEFHNYNVTWDVLRLCCIGHFQFPSLNDPKNKYNFFCNIKNIVMYVLYGAVSAPPKLKFIFKKTSGFLRSAFNNLRILRSGIKIVTIPEARNISEVRQIASSEIFLKSENS